MFFWRYSWLFRTITDSQKRTAIILIFKLIVIIANYRMNSRRISPPVAISQTDWTVVNKTVEEQEETFEIIDTFSVKEEHKSVEDKKQNGECDEHSSEKTVPKAGDTNSVRGVLRSDKKEG